MPPPKDLGDAFNRFGQWAGDTLGLNVGSPIDQAQFKPDLTNFNQDRERQIALYNQYQQMAAGQGPSLAQGQLQQATDQNIRQAMALGQAQQGQGLGYASALRNIADQGAAARQQMAGQSALIRNQEQMQALGAMGGLGGQMMGGGLQASGMGMQGQQFGASLEANRQAAEAGNRRQFFGGILNAAGGLLGLGGGGGQPQVGGNGGGGWGGPTGYGIPGMAYGGMVPSYACGGEAPGKMARGGPVDSEKNDTVPAMLSPGEIVIPRSVTLAPDAPERAAAFVAAIMEHRKSMPRSDKHHMVMGAEMERKHKRKAA